MGTFEARHARVSGNPAAELTLRRTELDDRPVRIDLVRQVRVREFDRERLPFAWEFLEASDDRPYDVLRVVAGPGVAVSLQGVPDTAVLGTLGARGSGPEPMVDVIRVQDPEVIPPLGAEIHLQNVLQSSEFNTPAGEAGSLTRGISLMHGTPTNWFVVTTTATETVIRHVRTNQALVLSVPAFSTLFHHARDAYSRYAWEIDPEGVLGDARRPLVKIVKTPDATVGLSERIFLDAIVQSLEPGVEVDETPFIGWYKVWEAGFHDIPPQGTPIEPDEGWRELTSIPRAEHAEEALAMAVVDASLSMIPYVGDAIDIAEFFYAVGTGRDRWGRRVEGFDYAILGLGALLPFAGAATLRYGPRLLRAFGRRAGAAVETVEALLRGITPEDARLIRTVESAIAAGRPLSADQMAAFVRLLERLNGGTRPPLDELLNAGRTGFVHAELQTMFQRYARRNRRADPVRWALAQTSGRARAILVARLGPDYVQQTRIHRRFIHLVNVARPHGWDAQRARRLIEELMQQRSRLLERLDGLLAQRRSTDVVARFLANVRPLAGHFRILKGNLAELLSMPLQRRILRQIADVPGGEDCRLLTGVRIRTADGRSMLFSDNLVGRIRRGNLEIFAVNEVKAGYSGGAEATEQVFEWIEGRLDDGMELVLPRGSRIIAPDGAEEILTRELSFTYRPGTRDAGQVIGLASAPRFLITARGVSHLGVDSAMQIAPNVTRMELDYSASELDYLCAQIITGLE